jgi:hypothetical protein
MKRTTSPSVAIGGGSLGSVMPKVSSTLHSSSTAASESTPRLSSGVSADSCDASAP